MAKVQTHAQERLTRALMKAREVDDCEVKADTWPSVGAAMAVASPYLNVGNAKAASQTYNAGSLFTSNAMTKG